MKELQSTCAPFRAMHSEFVVIPTREGRKQARKLDVTAIATTSAGLAASMGRDDLSLSRDEILRNICTLCGTTDLPVNADFEAAFTDGAEGIAATIGLAAQAGVSEPSIKVAKQAFSTIFRRPSPASRWRALRQGAPEHRPSKTAAGLPGG